MGASTQQIEQVYRTRFAAFRTALVPLAGGEEAARDAVQEAFAQALRHRRRFRGDGPLEAWIWRIAFRVALKAKPKHLEVELEHAVAEAAALGATHDPELEAALKTLSPRRKLVVFLRYFADMSYEEIAAVCGIGEGTVAATLAQAHAHLLATLQPEGAPA